MTARAAIQTNHVTLNLFQGPWCLIARTVQVEGWMLKQGQHDETGGQGA